MQEFHPARRCRLQSGYVHRITARRDHAQPRIGVEHALRQIVQSLGEEKLTEGEAEKLEEKLHLWLPRLADEELRKQINRWYTDVWSIREEIQRGTVMGDFPRRMFGLAAESSNLLANVTPSTDVTVDVNARIDSRPVYQLVLTPHAAASTVQDVTIAIDAATDADPADDFVEAVADAG